MGTLQLVVASCFPIPALPAPGELLLSIFRSLRQNAVIYEENILKLAP